MRQALEHQLQANWHTADGKYHATALIRCEPIPDWKHRGSVPGAVMAHARRLETTLLDQHPDAQALKVDVVESLIEWDDTGKGRRLYATRIGQHPTDAAELDRITTWDEIRAKERNR